MGQLSLITRTTPPTPPHTHTEIKKLADLGRALGTAEAGLIGVGEAREGTVAKLDDHEVEHGDVLGHDTPAARLAAALALAAPVTLETFGS